MGKIPEKCLCAHVHDACKGVVNERRYVDALVSSIYKSDRTIPLCKEIAYLAKSIVAESEIDLSKLNHLPLTKGRDGEFITTESGIPELRGTQYQLLNRLIHMPRSRERDKALILMTKLHGYVEPLKIKDGIRETISMIRNIETKLEPVFEWNRFRAFARRWIDLHPTISSYDWHEHIRTLQQMCEETMSSDKKKPSIRYLDKAELFKWDNESTKDEEDSYSYTCILASKEFRELYEYDKACFDRLLTGRLTIEVTDDSHIYAITPIHTPSGRMGIRLQEAGKVRTLWMPHPVFESLLNPMVVLLERLVKESPFQTAYDDDAVAAAQIRRCFFPDGRRSGEELFSIDQSSFTDNFPYQLQRIIIEEMVGVEALPALTLPTLDLMVKGGYMPSSPYMEFHAWEEEVHFANGTPMGGDGLWMLSTLSHQILIEYLQHKLGRHTDFRVQGDDAILKGRDLYELYKSTLSDLGCGINEAKTLVSYRAVEYCGFITTEEQSVPMFRPHNRFKDSIRDLFSDRAVQSFGSDAILQWVVDNRPSDLMYLQIAGIIPISEEDDDYVFVQNGKAILRAMHARSEILDAIESREQQARYYVNRDAWPHVNEEEPELDSPQHRSDYNLYCDRLSTITRLFIHLLSNNTSRYEEISEEILDLVSTVKEEHEDYLSEIHIHKDVNVNPARRLSSKEKKKEDDSLMSNIKKAVNILLNTQTSHNKEVHQDDDYSL